MSRAPEGSASSLGCSTASSAAGSPAGDAAGGQARRAAQIEGAAGLAANRSQLHAIKRVFVRRDGRWIVPQRIEVRVTSGSVKLDFTEAVLSRPRLLIDAEVRSGRLLLVTKPGILVDADDVAIKSGNVKVREPWGDSVPVTLRVDVSGKVRSGHITARPPRRTFWQWLLGRPG